MDSAALKVLMDSQNQTFRSALDIIVEQFKSRITDMETKISDLTRSLEFSQAEISDLKGEVKTLRKSETVNRSTIDELQTRVESSEQRMNYQEDYNRRNNIRISGLNESPNGETWEQTADLVSTLLGDKLQLPSVKLERAHRVGLSGSSAPRTVVARFEHFRDREAAMRNARKLKGTGVYFNEDLCPASQEKVKSQLPLMKQARSEGKIAYFKHTRLVIKERTTRPPASNAPPGGSVDPKYVPAAGAVGTSDGSEPSCGAGRAAAAKDDGAAGLNRTLRDRKKK